MELRSTPALTTSVSDASESILPTTGTTPESVSFAALTAVASALPEIAPEMARYAVKAKSTAFKLAPMIQPTRPRSFARVSSPIAASAQARAR